MKMDIDQLFERCCDMLEGIGLPVSRNRILLKVSSRMTSTFGRCHSEWVEPEGIWYHTITIAARVLKDSVPTKTKENVMIHELLHSRHPRDHHGSVWTGEALTVFSRLGYEITRTAKSEDIGVETLRPKRKYIIACEKCGQQWSYARMCRPVQHPSLYKHNKCGGTCKRVA